MKQVKCINTTGVDENKLTVGKVYTVSNPDNVGDYQLINNLGLLAWYYAWHFTVLAPGSCPQCGIQH
jgi:hypothetical protein